MTGSDDDDAALEFYENLAGRTNGTLQSFSLHKNGSIKDVNMIFPVPSDDEAVNTARSYKKVRFHKEKKQNDVEKPDGRYGNNAFSKLCNTLVFFIRCVDTSTPFLEI